MEEDIIDLQQLRNNADAKLQKQPASDNSTPAEVAVLLQELRIHRNELAKQKRALQELKIKLTTAREQYENLFETAPVGYFILDHTGIIVNVNSAGCNLLGMEQNVLQGKFFPAFTSGKGNKKKIATLLSAVFNSDAMHSIELKLINGEGKVFHSHIQGIRIPVEKEQDSRCRLMVQSTGRGQQTAQLELLNAELEIKKETARQYLDMAGVLFVALDVKGNITMINRKGCELLGYSRTETNESEFRESKPYKLLLGLNWFECFIPPKDKKQVKRGFARLMADLPGNEYSENDILCLDGSTRNISWHNSVLKNASGEITGILSAGTDITIRKQEDRKLKKALSAQHESELRFRNIFENANDAISIIDAKTHRIKNTNSKLLSRLGYSMKEILKLTIFDIYTPEYAEKGRLHLSEIHENNHILFEGIQMHKDGSSIPVEVNSCMIEYDGKKAFLSISRDISGRKKVEALLMAHLLEGQEKERQRIAVDLHDSIQPLLATIKRKMETLNPVHNAAIPEKLKDFKVATNLLDKTFKEIRAISHNLVPPSLKDFGLVATLRELCESMDQPSRLRVSFYSTGMDDKSSVKKMNYHVATGLYRIAQELLHNAIKHSKARSITLQLVRHKRSWVLMIEDDGIGFNEPHKKKGLGINSMSARVKMMDGSFDIDSRKGRGTIITVEVPVP